MNVIVINGSPKMDKGNTAVILAPFLDGMRDAGADVELYYTKKLHILPCQGDNSCWFKTPGICFQHDDMEWLRPNYERADIAVLATPLYVDGMSGPLKNLVDRLVPVGKAVFELRDGHSRHAMRDGLTLGSLVLVSSCGFWEMDNFDPLIAHMRAFSKNANCSFVGALLRPHATVLVPMLEAGAPVRDVFEAAKEAGRQLVTTGEISAETLAIVSRPLISLNKYMEAVNQRFQQVLGASEI
jgi:multimeric flavodoxin WrbA